MRELAIFLLVCALIAGLTFAASEIRLERNRGARLAAVVAECANGRAFRVSSTLVHCTATEVR